MTDNTNALGDYLRARRELVTPDSVGLPQLGIRRVPGLRREEVAMLAGISADYYLRLEQGRDRNPSIQVLESLARVLQLDEAGTAYLLSLGSEKPRRTRRRPRKEVVPPGIRKLLDALTLPAFVEGRYFDVLAANPLATTLSPRLATGRNRLRDVFLDPAERALYPDWEHATVQLVAGFRESVGTDTHDSRFIELVGELSLASDRFRTLWARHDVQAPEGASVTLDHPQIGELTLNREKLTIGGTAGQLLVVYHADHGTANADKLSLLASYQADLHLSGPTERATARPK
jgi:transcriptional regulator with XRE-family HTH domain